MGGSRHERAYFKSISDVLASRRKMHELDYSGEKPMSIRVHPWLNFSVT